MKTKKLFTVIFSMLFALSLVITSTVPVSAATRSKTVNSSRAMDLILHKGQTGNSSIVSFKVRGLPSAARVTKIVVKPGKLSYKGAVLTNRLMLTSSNKSGESSVAWRGYSKDTVTFNNQLKGSLANGTYTIRFNGTFVGGYLSHGTILNIATKEYSSPSITIYYET